MRARKLYHDAQGISGELPLFDGVPEDRVATVLKCLNARVVEYAKADMIIRQSDCFGYAVYLLDGEALAVSYDAWGNRSIISVFAPDSLIAGNGLFEGQTRVPLDIVAKDDCRVLFLNIDAEVSGCTCCMKYASIVKENAMRLLVDMNSHLIKKLDTLSLRSTRSKLLAYLTEQAEEQESTRFSIPLSRQQLADYLFIERTALSRELSAMQKDGLISYNKNQFVLHAPRAREAVYA